MGNRKLATILRCTGLALLVLGIFALLPAAAQAQCTNPSHGVTIEKSCISPKNICATDADCSNGDLCDGIEQCATAHANGAPSGVGSNVVDCTITLTNPAAHCDDIRIEEAADQILNGTALPNSTITISATSGAVTGTCAVGTDLGGANTCTLPPGASVSFSANYYTVQATDPNPLPDQATITVRDLCNVQTTGCNSLTTNGVQFTASTLLQSGCSDGTPLLCDDGLFCTDDSCVPATGCTTVAHPCTDDGLFCNGPETCNETTDACVSGPAVVCPSDNDLCNGPESCDEATDTCTSPGPPLVCDDGLFCTDDSCDPLLGCTTVAHPCASDGLFCNGPETCDETADDCVSGPAVVCPDDLDACDGPEACDEATDTCTSQGPPVDCTDFFFCSTESCDPATGQCVAGTQDNFCDDNNVCTDDSCDEAADACVNTVDNTNDPICLNEEICRTPGFWGTHGGTEKSSSVNITQAVLDAFGGTLSVCGATINNTLAGNVNSALEAICVSPKGDSRLQLARQLTAAALNCGITNAEGTETCTLQAGGTPCTGVSIEDVWDACNAACPTGTTAVVDGHTISCIGAIDCFNNGGLFDPATGNCSDAIDSCHDRQLVNGCFNFQPPGAAGSPRECNEARKNTIVVVPPLAP